MSVGSLIARPVSLEQLSALRSVRQEALFRMDWVPAPVPIHQLVIAGLQTRFETLRTETGSAAEPVPIAGRELEVAREIDDVVRGLRTSFEQQVANSLRGIETRPPHVRIARPRQRPSWPLLVAGVVALLLVVPPVVWLLTN